MTFYSNHCLPAPPHPTILPLPMWQQLPALFTPCSVHQGLLEYSLSVSSAHYRGFLWELQVLLSAPWLMEQAAGRTQGNHYAELTHLFKEVYALKLAAHKLEVKSHYWYQKALSRPSCDSSH